MPQLVKISDERQFEDVLLTKDTVPVMKVKGDSEAVKYMNDSEFGLTASIWTKDTDRGYELAEDVEAGTVFVNRCDYPAPVRFLIQAQRVSALRDY